MAGRLLSIAYFGAHPELPPRWRLLVITGFLGGLTTFSSFSGEVVMLMRQDRLAMACAAMALHLGGSLLLTFAGMATASLLRGRRAGGPAGWIRRPAASEVVAAPQSGWPAAWAAIHPTYKGR